MDRARTAVHCETDKGQSSHHMFTGDPQVKSVSTGTGNGGHRGRSGQMGPAYQPRISTDALAVPENASSPVTAAPAS